MITLDTLLGAEDDDEVFELSLDKMKEIIDEAIERVMNGQELMSFDLQRGQDDNLFIFSFSYNGWSYGSVGVLVR